MSSTSSEYFEEYLLLFDQNIKNLRDIEEIDDDYYHNVHEILLNNNELITLQDDERFQYLKHVEKIDLSNNLLKSLTSPSYQVNFLSYFANTLQYLDISNNQLINLNGIEQCKNLKNIKS